MKKSVEVTILFEIEEGETVSLSDLDKLEAWISGTFDNAPMDEEVGFPDSIESYAQVVGINVVTHRPKS